MEPTPIFTALAAPARHHDGHRGAEGRTVPELLRALRAEQPAGAVPRGRVGHVPGVLSFPRD